LTLTVHAVGDVVVGSAVTAISNVNLLSDTGEVTVNGTVSAGFNVNVRAAGNVNAAGQSFTSTTHGHIEFEISGGGNINAGDLTTTDTFDGEVIFDTSGDIVVGDINAADDVVFRQAINSFTAGDMVADASFTIPVTTFFTVNSLDVAVLFYDDANTTDVNIAGNLTAGTSHFTFNVDRDALPADPRITIGGTWTQPSVPADPAGDVNVTTNASGSAVTSYAAIEFGSVNIPDPVNNLSPTEVDSVMLDADELVLEWF